jgi:hypothetical protein
MADTVEIAEISEPPLRRGSCVLNQPEIAIEVQKTIRFFDGQR